MVLVCFTGEVVISGVDVCLCVRVCAEYRVVR